MGYEYEMVSDEYIRRSLHEDLMNYLYTPCYNLSTILGDLNGKVNPSTSKEIVKGLNIAAPGIVLLGYIGESEDIEHELLGTETYTNEVSPLAYEIYSKYLVNDTSVVLADPSDTSVSTPLMVLSSDKVASLVYGAISALYLDTMALYTELLITTPSKNLSITPQDLHRMDSNIRWITAKIEYSLVQPVGLLEVLRELQRTLMGIRNIKHIFASTYSSEINDTEFIGGV